MELTGPQRCWVCGKRHLAPACEPEPAECEHEWSLDPATGSYECAKNCGAAYSYCEHEWYWCEDEKLYICVKGPPKRVPAEDGSPKYVRVVGCKETRTVADFWRETVPEHPNPKALCWARNRWVEPGNTKEWRQPIFVSINFERRGVHKWSEWQFFHHPDYIIEPPPTPDSKLTP